MGERKYMNIGEFRRSGFLQEANRQFFHPHGLALEVTTATDEAFAVVRITASELAELTKLCADRPQLLGRLSDAVTYQPGDSCLSGVWDVRDDPEGVLFGSWDSEQEAKVKRVADERARHAEARCAMFGGGSDIEHVGFTWDGGADA
jgi:hypothetical protein